MAGFDGGWGHKPTKPKKKGNGTGGTGPSGGGGSGNPANVKDPYGSQAISDLYEPPPFSTYDPALDAAADAAVRGYQDIAQDAATARKTNRQDYRQTREDISQSNRRGEQDIRRDKRRGRTEFQQERQDIGKTQRRSQQDFNRRLGDLFIKYGIKANVQMQESNAAGVADGGSLAAGAAARAFNAGREVSVINQAKARQDQDIAIALERLGIDKTQFMADINRSQKRLGEDTARSRELAKRDYRREKRAQKRNLKRAEREAIQAQIDYSDQAAYQAHELNPGAVDAYGDPKSNYKGPAPPDEEKPKKGGGRKKGKGKRRKKRGGFSATPS